MRYDFSRHFLKVLPQDGTFSKAWEGLCHELLSADEPNAGYIRLGPPDKGVDIWGQANRVAVQCKSTEAGVGGTIASAESMKSLQSAYSVRKQFRWKQYHFATNASYSGQGCIDIQAEAKALGVAARSLRFLPPLYWSNLCEKFIDRVKHRLDFRVTLTEAEVESVLRRRHYRAQYTSRVMALLQNSRPVRVTNDRTALELELPLSPDMTVRESLDVIVSVLGLDRARAHFADLRTLYAAVPSLKHNGQALSADQALSSSGVPLEELEVFISIRWGDDVREFDAGWMLLGSAMQMDEATRRAQTVSRAKEHLQATMWSAVKAIIDIRTIVRV